MNSEQLASNDFLAVVRSELSLLMQGGGAHASFEDAVKNLPEQFRGSVPNGLPYSAWQIVEHIRIAQHDMLAFSRNSDGKYEEMKWPDDYWPQSAKPPSVDAWDQSVSAIAQDREALEEVLHAASAEELVKPFAWGDGQTLLKEALQVADHNAYHVGELVVLRRVLGIWK